MRLPLTAVAILVLILVLPLTLFLLGVGYAFRNWPFGTTDSGNQLWLFFKRGVLICGGVAWLVLTVLIANAPVGPAPESASIANLRTINTAEVTYLSASNGEYGSIPDLISAGLLDSGFEGPRSGYVYTVTTDGKQYTATAFPASVTAGKYGYYSWPDAVIRYAESTTPTCVPCFPDGMAGRPIQ
jgi:hypothetical protein